MPASPPRQLERHEHRGKNLAGDTEEAICLLPYLLRPDMTSSTHHLPCLYHTLVELRVEGV